MVSAEPLEERDDITTTDGRIRISARRRVRSAHTLDTLMDLLVLLGRQKRLRLSDLIGAADHW
jgi:hypothetical protein